MPVRLHETSSEGGRQFEEVAATGIPRIELEGGAQARDPWAATAKRIDAEHRRAVYRCRIR